MHAKFLELDVAEPTIASDNIYFVMPDIVTLSLSNFDNSRSFVGQVLLQMRMWLNN